MGDGGHEDDDLMSRRADGGKTWSRQRVIYAKQGQYTFLGAVVEDRISGTLFVGGWDMPAGVVDDLG